MPNAKKSKFPDEIEVTIEDAGTPDRWFSVVDGGLAAVDDDTEVAIYKLVAVKKLKVTRTLE